MKKVKYVLGIRVLNIVNQKTKHRPNYLGQYDFINLLFLNNKHPSFQKFLNILKDVLV